MSERLRRIAEYLSANDDYIIISHIAPDGDTLGSSLALYAALLSMGKHVTPVCQDRIPTVYSFLPHAADYRTPSDASVAKNVIAVDCADIGRLGNALELFSAAAHTISIDHHGTNTMFAKTNEVRADSASAGEIVFDLLKLLPLTITAETASCLYVAVMTDTGNFTHGNTSANALRAAASLVELGANAADLNRSVYRSIPVQKARLLGYALSNIELIHNGAIAFTAITQPAMLQLKAKAEDTEGIIDHLCDIATVEIAIVVRECNDGEYKVSLRGKNYADVAAISQKFGGGGHRAAAGFKIGMDFNSLFDALISTAEAAIKK